MKKLSTLLFALSITIAFSSTACYGQTSESKTICISQKHADSIAVTIVRYKQLQSYTHALELENTYAYGVIDNQAEQLAEADTVQMIDAEIITAYEKETKRQRKKAKLLGGIGAAELILILILL